MVCVAPASAPGAALRAFAATELAGPSGLPAFLPLGATSGHKRRGRLPFSWRPTSLAPPPLAIA
eukprot:4637344-Lingulodinium_polyedra.AAC.1